MPSTRTTMFSCWLVIIGLFNTSLAEEPIDPTAGGRYALKTEHDPNGIGKFYLGREIAYVMGHQGIPWLERVEREEEERLSLLMECLPLKPGEVAADVGAGSGILTIRLANIVGEKGKVLAIDIQQEMLDVIAVKCKRRKVDNVELILGTNKSPKLKPESIDMALMVDVYHEFDFPYEMLTEMATALKPGGRIVFVEYRKEDPNVPIKEVHKMTEEQVKKEAALPELGLMWKETIDKLPRQHVIVFERAAKAKP